MTSTYANIRQRVYRGVIDSPKTEQSFRKAALSEGLLREIENWRKLAPSTAAHAWVFPSERMTPMAKENVWRRWIGPKLEKAGLGWVNFQVMRRTHASLMSDLGVEGKLVADQLGRDGHSGRRVRIGHSPLAEDMRGAVTRTRLQAVTACHDAPLNFVPYLHSAYSTWPRRIGIGYHAQW
jgi:integrase